jgi:glutaredoxin
VPRPIVTVYHAEGCHLCDRALDVVREAGEQQQFTLVLVDIGGDQALEAQYREHLPVIEIDGVRAFTYFVTVEGLLGRLEARPLGGDGSPAR